MQSISPEVNAIHAAFSEAIGYEVAFFNCYERYWYEALKMGMTCDDVKLIVKSRQRRIKDGVRHEECLKIRNIAGSEESIAEALEEVASIRAKMRVRVFPSGKSEVLRATGRPDEPEQSSARPISEYLGELRRAAQ